MFKKLVSYLGLDKYTRTDALRLLVSVYGLIISMGLIAFGEIFKKLVKWDIFGTFFIELGIALFIAVFIGLTIDRLQKKELEEIYKKNLDEFKESSFNSLYGWMIPETYLDAIKEQVLSQGVSRSNCLLEYVIRDVSPDDIATIRAQDNEVNVDGRVIMKQYLYYTMTNHTASRKTIDIPFSIEKEDAPLFNRVNHINIIRNGKVEQYPEDKILSTQCQEEWNSIDNCFSICGIEISAGESIDVEILATALRSKKHTREVYTSLRLTDGITVKVYNETDRSDMQIFCSGLTFNNLKKYYLDDVVAWKLNRPLLPYQGVMMWWHLPEIESGDEIKTKC